MDSPKTTQLTSTLTNLSAIATIAISPSDSPPDSFSDFVDHLFPIEPSKCDSEVQGLDSFVFSSPHLNVNVESSLLKRTRSSNTELAAESQEANNKISEQTELCPFDNFLADFEEVAGSSIIQVLCEKAEQNFEENFAPEVCRPLEIENEQSSIAFYCTESDLSTSQAFRKQENEDLCAQDTCTIYQDGLDFMPQYLQERLSNANLHGAYECDTQETLDGAFQPLSISQPQSSMCQRYLQSKEATANATQKNLLSSNFTSNVKATSQHPSSVEDIELSVSNLDSALNTRVPAKSLHSLHTLPHPDSGGNPPLGISRPSGIGLHLNSVISVAMKNHGLKNDTTCSRDVSSSTEDMEGHESKSISSTSSITLQSCHAVKFENFETPCETRNFDYDPSFNLEKINNLPHKRKRKKSSVSSSGDDSKRCNCKKSKCLKLYCDCFAAGIYCPESCSCEGCFNNPENEQTVVEIRHQIESRDPLAFAPKVIEDSNELTVNNENGRPLNPSLARHKKGCSCKKSMCLKQYCECYQANVGCTIRCRCEDCRNIHGKKEEPCATPPEVACDRADVGISEAKLINDRDTAAFRKDISHSEFYDQQHNLASQTPFQYLDHENDSSKSRLVSRRCLPSPEFDATSSSSPSCTDLFVETKTNIFDVGSYQWQHMNCDNGGASSTSSIQSKPRGWINVSRIGQLGTRGSSMSWLSSPDTLSIQASETPIKYINENSPKNQTLPLHRGSENEVGKENSSSWLKGRRYILKSMPHSPPLTAHNKYRATDNSSGSDCNDINSKVIKPECPW